MNLRITRVQLATYVPLLTVALLIIAIYVFSPSDPARVDPKTYSSLLGTIAKGESRGNYNAHYGNAANSETKFTEMTVAEVLRWQEDYVKSGSPSSAVGKYQIIRPTLVGLVKQLNIDQSEVFGAPLQDRMAIALLERRGAVEYVDNKLTREQFAANIAQEWAALPKVIGENPETSYYAGDGLNEARISTDEVLGAVKHLKKM